MVAKNPIPHTGDQASATNADTPANVHTATAGTSSSSAADPNRGKKTADKVGIIFAALMLTMLMSSLGQMIFGAALPTIVGELGGVDEMSWVISAFMVTMTIAMPITGQLGDRIGRKWVYITGIAIFLVGSGIGGFANDMGTLITGRAIQGFGAGIMMISSQSIVAEIVSARERGKYMGIMGGVFGLSSVLGPVLGGWFTDGPGWRWGLWINIPIGLIALVICIFVLKLRVGDQGLKGFDWMGFAAIAITTSTLILMTTWGGSEYSWSSPTIITMGAVVVVGVSLTIFIESRAQHPLIPIRMFKNRNMALTTLAGTILGLAMTGVLGYMPTYLQMVHTLSPTAAGFMMIPMMIGLVGVSTAIGFVISHTGTYKPYPIAGMAVTALALWLMSRMTIHTTLVGMGILFFIFGVGLGLVMQVLVLIVQNSFPVTAVGTATAANNFFRQIGSTLGASVIGSMFIQNMKDEMATRLPEAIQSLGKEGAAIAQKYAGADVTNSLTPEAVAQLPDAIRDAVLTSYNDGLTPVIAMMVPLAIGAMVILFPLRKDPLKETIS